MVGRVEMDRWVGVRRGTLMRKDTRMMRVRLIRLRRRCSRKGKMMRRLSPISKPCSMTRYPASTACR